jgi:two-component system, chemotaxis family, chemotaxis protein CheY
MFPANTKILVVDDMMTMRKIVAKACKDLGYQNIADASDGAKAWEALNNSTEPIGLIISDWNMPNASGLDFLKRVRTSSKYGKLPFIMVTAESEQSQIVEAAAAGVSGYIIKPFTAEALKAKIAAVYTKVAA